MVDRRNVLRGGAAVGFGSMFMGGVAWSRPDATVRTILPSVNADTIAVKVLLDTPPSAAPCLSIDGRQVRARRMDRDGYCWGFVQPGLSSGTRHAIVLTDAQGIALREPWTLATLPAPDAPVEHVRILLYTCAGGDEDFGREHGYEPHLPIATRRALLDCALSFEPDLAIANGDHIYWDQRTRLRYRGDEEIRRLVAEYYHSVAWLDEDQAFDSPANRQALNTIIGRQIAGLYEDRFASVPLFFISDDHDYFENDNAGPWGYSFPPRPFNLGLQRCTAALAYPFALGRPDLPRYSAETVESLRFGKLIEMALFDCRRGWSTEPPSGVESQGGVLLPDVEAFLVDRLKRSDAQHYVQVPSNPFGWSRGALGEWYADDVHKEGRDDDKGYWMPGWFEQHQRLAQALTDQRGRAAISISGDIHASGSKQITRSGDIDLSANPIEAILSGPIGAGVDGFPSRSRGQLPFTPALLEATDRSFEERNGFTLFDVYPDRIDVRQFRWRPPEPIEALASLQPAESFTIQRPG